MLIDMSLPSSPSFPISSFFFTYVQKYQRRKQAISTAFRDLSSLPRLRMAARAVQIEYELSKYSLSCMTNGNA